VLSGDDDSLKQEQQQEQENRNEDDSWSDDAEDGEAEKLLEIVIRDAEDFLTKGDLEGFSQVFVKNPQVVEIMDIDEMNSLLHWAANTNNITFARLLLQSGAEITENNERISLTEQMRNFSLEDESFTEMRNLLEEYEKLYE